MLALVIIFGVLAVAFAIELWSVESRLDAAEIVLAENGLLPQPPRHSTGVPVSTYDDYAG